MRPYRIVDCRVIFLTALLLASPAGAQDDSARAVVESFQTGLLAVMKDAESLTVRERYDRLLPEIERAFHLPLIIRIAIGSHWDRASTQQRDRLVTAFMRKNISTVATFFSGYSGQVFEIFNQRPAPQNTLMIDTRIVSPSGSSTDISYRLFKSGDRWRIIDVLLDAGISELSVRRSEYRGFLASKGIEGLIAALDGKADQLLAE